MFFAINRISVLVSIQLMFFFTIGAHLCPYQIPIVPFFSPSRPHRWVVRTQTTLTPLNLFFRRAHHDCFGIRVRGFIVALFPTPKPFPMFLDPCYMQHVQLLLSSFQVPYSRLNPCYTFIDPWFTHVLRSLFQAPCTRSPLTEVFLVPCFYLCTELFVPYTLH